MKASKIMIIANVIVAIGLIAYVVHKKKTEPAPGTASGCCGK